MTPRTPLIPTLAARASAGARALLLACGALALAAPAALAVNAYPSRPVTLVVPGPPGGITDQLGRLVAASMTSDHGVRVVVDNRPGAGGNLATELVARAEPDGYTVLMGTQGTMASNQFLYKSLRFDPARDFVAAHGLVSIPNLLVVNGKLPYQSVRELVAYAKGHPGKLTVSSAGNGTGSHLAGELFQTLAGVKFVHVPYKGSAPSINDLLAGQVDLTFDYPASTLTQVQAGKLRALAVTGASRLPALPQVPTIAEAGYPGAESTSWIGLFFPARTPAPVGGGEVAGGSDARAEGSRRGRGHPSHGRRAARAQRRGLRRFRARRAHQVEDHHRTGRRHPRLRRAQRPPPAFVVRLRAARARCRSPIRQSAEAVHACCPAHPPERTGAHRTRNPGCRRQRIARCAARAHHPAGRQRRAEQDYRAQARHRPGPGRALARTLCAGRRGRHRQ
ncbi:conserved exported hypothetical protein [Cupriavidus taiwanensis]|uniref:Extra-cytoplasmic solute receptor n=1 Tax=Cupriavidus taiwanensis TaxID=164546 RepID=A0A375I6F9_9BURK|nr:conserved exported hypothetical protein [Cupriavidus taiwanensis]